MDGIKSMGVNFEPIKENHGSNKRVFKKNQIKVMLPLFNNREYMIKQVNLICLYMFGIWLFTLIVQKIVGN